MLLLALVGSTGADAAAAAAFAGARPLPPDSEDTLFRDVSVSFVVCSGAVALDFGLGAAAGVKNPFRIPFALPLAVPPPSALLSFARAASCCFPVVSASFDDPQLVG